MTDTERAAKPFPAMIRDFATLAGLFDAHGVLRLLAAASGPLRRRLRGHRAAKAKDAGSVACSARERLRTQAWIALCGGLALLAVNLATPSAASAATAYLPTTTFGSAGSGDGQFELNPGPGAPGAGAAVDDASGDLYVVDTHNNRIERFEADGTFLAAWGWGVSNGAEEAQVCTSSCQAGIAGSGEGQLNTPVALAVDNTAGANAGDVYVADRENHRIEQFSSSGAYLSSFGSGIFKGGNSIAVDPTDGNVWVGDTTPGSTAAVAYDPADGSVQNSISIGAGNGNPFALALGPTGDVYVVDGNAVLVRRYDPSGTELGSFAPATSGVGPRSIAIDASGDVFIGDGTADQVTKYDASGHPLVNGFGPPTIAFPTGLATDVAGDRVYVVDGPNNDVSVFEAATLPTTTTEAASAVRPASATLKGSVNPEGLEVTECVFEWGETSEYGQIAPCHPEASEITGSSPVEVHAEIAALGPVTTYHFRLRAANANGAEYGADASFETAPAVELTTGQAGAVEPTSATLGGEIDPLGTALTDCHFSYVSEETFQADLGFGYSPDEIFTFEAAQAPCEEPNFEEVGSGPEPVAVHAPASALAPNTTYRFRLAAANEFGSTAGAEATFFTKAAPTATVLPATDLTRLTATLNGTLDPFGADTSYSFAYVSDADYQPGAPDPYAAGSATAPSDAGPGRTEQAVSQFLAGLRPATTYHFALTAISLSGTATSSDATFTTAPAQPPSATTGPASDVGATTATLAGTVDSGGLSTTYRFELGTTTAYGTSVFGSLGVGTRPQALSQAIAGLQPATTYHYRVVARNADGESTAAATTTFTTAALPQGVLPPPPDLKPTLATCPRGKVKKHGRCVNRSHHKRHAKADRRAHR